jgi:hypothetical protein
MRVELSDRHMGVRATARAAVTSPRGVGEGVVREQTGAP